MSTQRYFPPDYLDNTSEERQLKHVLTSLLQEWKETELDVASGFFEPEVWNLLGVRLPSWNRSACCWVVRQK
ncbi:MAG UNVERIFIED_CONTAM: hypothetical protein LVT10_21785 [Anaerolineae bacterium]